MRLVTWTELTLTLTIASSVVAGGGSAFASPVAPLYSGWATVGPGGGYGSDVGVDPATGAVFSTGLDFDGRMLTTAFMSDGAPLWERTLPDPCADPYDERSTLVVDADRGQIYVRGRYLVTSYDVDGNLLWRFPEDGLGELITWHDLVQDPGSGNVYVMGTRQISSTDTQIVTRALTPGGQLQWEQVYDADGDPRRLSISRGAAIAVGPDGSVYVAGSQNVESLYRLDQLVLSYTGAGDLRWARQVQVPGGDKEEGAFVAVTVAPDGSAVYATGPAEDALSTAALNPVDGTVAWIRYLREDIGPSIPASRYVLYDPLAHRVHVASEYPSDTQFGTAVRLTTYTVTGRLVRILDVPRAPDTQDDLRDATIDARNGAVYLSVSREDDSGFPVNALIVRSTATGTLDVTVLGPGQRTQVTEVEVDPDRDRLLLTGTTANPRGKGALLTAAIEPP